MTRGDQTGIYGVILDKTGDHILLIRKTSGPHAGTFDLPGGASETDRPPDQILRRKVKAQTGCKIRELIELEISGDHCDSIAGSSAGKVFAATLIGLPSITDRKTDSGRADWVNVRDIENGRVKTAPRVPIGLRIAKQLRDQKVLTIFGGSPTLGKSTVLAAVQQLVPGAHILKQSMRRAARTDDNLDFLTPCDPEVFDDTPFWSRQSNTGIPKSEIDRFLTSNSRFGFCVAGHLELLGIAQHRHPTIQIHTVLLRMAEDPLTEAMALGASIALHHEDPMKRLGEHLDFLRMMRDQPDQFAHIDHMLFRTDTLRGWIQYLDERIGLRLTGTETDESAYDAIIRHSSEVRPVRGNFKINALLNRDPLTPQ
jgi:ADP-ribose pyrophosphatase YjhB (NUDIX family)